MKNTFMRASIALGLLVLPLFATAASVEDELLGISNATQKGLPLRVSDELQATSMTAAGKALLARYHFTKESKSISDVGNMKNEFYKNTINSQCTHPDMAKLISKGAYLKYEYYDIDNRFVFGYAINQNTCERFQ